MLISSLPVSWTHIHPVLVHFTTALLPVSFVSDIAGKYSSRESFTSAAWWMLFFGAIATPLTALAGWLWASELGSIGGHDMSTHRWLGLSLVAGFSFMAIWRGRLFILDKKPGYAYLAFAAIVLAALMYQGYLGGKMTLG